jgi:hypothetical protein
MIIRPANKFDLPYFVHIAKKVQDMSFIPDDKKVIDTHMNVLFNTILHGGGIALIAESEQPIGIVVGTINENLWVPQMYMLTQVLLYVDEEWRHTKAGYKLLKAYNEETEKLINDGRIEMSVIHAAEPLHDIDFSRFGYKMSEKIWQLEI